MTILRLALTLLLLASLAIVTPSCARDETATEQATPLERQEKDLPTKWLAFDDGLAKARTENKPIFVEFYAEWCVFCKKFQKETIKNQQVASMLAENFVYVRLNAENSNVELAQAFGINAYPSLVFLDSKGKPITMLSGFIPPHQFMPVLAYIEQKCYETQISFRQFAQKGSCN
ncbi:MAG: thioredoxin family protein [Deltaproteobacteria bacterium]